MRLVIIWLDTCGGLSCWHVKEIGETGKIRQTREKVDETEKKSLLIMYVTAQQALVQHAEVNSTLSRDLIFRVVRPCICHAFFYACHILWTMHARVLKFHLWIPHGKIAEPYVFFLSELSPFLDPLKKSEWSADRGWVDYLINFWANSVEFFQSYGPLKIRAFQTCQQDISKTIWARSLKLDHLTGNDK